MNIQNTTQPIQGILLVNKPRGLNSFKLVAILRKRLGVKKIGHAGTLDPFATGVMVMLIGREYTRLSDTFLNHDKEYIADVHLGSATDTHDCDGVVTSTSTIIPTHDEIVKALAAFQGTIEQVPPMFSAKKIGGKKLYELARQGKEIERKPSIVTMTTKLISYEYPILKINVSCSKGTYIRSIAHELGISLGCGAHLVELQRTRSGPFRIEQCMEGSLLLNENTDIKSLLINNFIYNLK